MGFDATVDIASSVLKIYPLREEEGWRFSLPGLPGFGLPPLPFPPTSRWESDV